MPRVAGRFSDSETSWVLPGDFFEFNIKFFRLLWLGVASVLKKIVRLHRFFLHHISLESKLNGRQKVKGGNGSITALISTSIIASIITLNIGVGCGCSQGVQRAVLCAVRVADFLAEGGWRASPGRGGRVGVPWRGRACKNFSSRPAAYPQGFRIHWWGRVESEGTQPGCLSFPP